MPTLTERPPRRRPQETAMLQVLRDAFPLAFPAADADIRPLALSTREDVTAWAATRPDLDLRRVQQALAHYCARIAYRRTLIAGRMRISLQGAEVESVTAEAEALARAAIAETHEARAQAEAARVARRERAAAEQERIQAEAAVRRAAKAAKPPKGKPKAKPPAPAHTPEPPPPAAATKVGPVVIVKKVRRVVPS